MQYFFHFGGDGGNNGCRKRKDDRDVTGGRGRVVVDVDIIVYADGGASSLIIKSSVVVTV